MVTNSKILDERLNAWDVVESKRSKSRKNPTKERDKEADRRGVTRQSLVKLGMLIV